MVLQLNGIAHFFQMKLPGSFQDIASIHCLMKYLAKHSLNC